MNYIVTEQKSSSDKSHKTTFEGHPKEMIANSSQVLFLLVVRAAECLQNGSALKHEDPLELKKPRLHCLFILLADEEYV